MNISLDLISLSEVCHQDFSSSARLARLHVSHPLFLVCKPALTSVVLWAKVKGQAVYPLMYRRKEAGRLFSALTAVISTPALGRLGGKWSQADGCPNSGTNFSHRCVMMITDAEGKFKNLQGGGGGGRNTSADLILALVSVWKSRAYWGARRSSVLYVMFHVVVM